MRLIPDPFNPIAALVGEHFDATLQLSEIEIKTLRGAMDICTRADNLLRPHGDEDDYNAFSYAEGELGDILAVYKK